MSSKCETCWRCRFWKYFFFIAKFLIILVNHVKTKKVFSLTKPLLRQEMVFGIVAGSTVILSCSWSVNSYIVVSRPSVPSTRCSASARGTGAWPVCAGKITTFPTILRNVSRSLRSVRRLRSAAQHGLLRDGGRPTTSSSRARRTPSRRHRGAAAEADQHHKLGFQPAEADQHYKLGFQTHFVDSMISSETIRIWMSTVLKRKRTTPQASRKIAHWHDHS